MPWLVKVRSEAKAFSVADKPLINGTLNLDCAIRISRVDRIPTDETCAGAVLFLLSRYADAVTGAVLDVNAGGFTPL